MFEWLEMRSASQPALSRSSRSRAMRPGTSIGARALRAGPARARACGADRDGRALTSAIVARLSTDERTRAQRLPRRAHGRADARAHARADARAHARADARAHARADARADRPAPSLGP